MDYLDYTIEDFLVEESFVNYCFQLNDEDVLYWENVLIEQPALIDKINQAKDLCLMLSVRVDNIEKDLALGKLKEAIDKLDHGSKSKKEKVRLLTNKTKRWLSIAASLLLIASVSVFVAKLRFNKPDAYLWEEHKSTQLVETAVDETKTIRLQDGSTVFLNGNSKLRITADFNKTNRILWLEGEALFEATKKKDLPFIIRTNMSETTALGTSFKVRDYPGQDERSIMLITGKVQVKGIDHEGQMPSVLILSPREKASILLDGSLMESVFDESDINDWRNRKINFDTSNFEEISSKISNIYGVSLIANKEVASEIAFTGKFFNNSLEEVMSAIAFSNRIHYSIINSNVYISK